MGTGLAAAAHPALVDGAVGTLMDFAESFTRSAREVVLAAWQRRLLFLFDYRGPLLWLDTDEGALGRAVQRLARAGIELLHDGFVFVSAQVDLHDSGLADIAVSIAGTGERAGDAQIAAKLRELQLHEQPRTEDVSDGARVATGACPISGAAVSFAANRSDGILFALDLTVPASRLDVSEPPPDAGGERAWVLSGAPGISQSLARRLQRLGWSTSTFASPASATEYLARMAPGMARPSLVVATAALHSTVVGMHELRALLPPRSQLLLATALGAPAIDVPAGIELCHWPLSPAELTAMTRCVQGGLGLFSGETLPAPVAFEDRPPALAVDDNQVNLLVATGLLQMAGFEVETAMTGEDAIAQCLRHPPQFVLMDVHMPGIDGIETTRRLRRLQREGALPHFRIVAATADVVPSVERACRDAGMDGYLSKPLTLQAIERELQRIRSAPRHTAG